MNLQLDRNDISQPQVQRAKASVSSCTANAWMSNALAKSIKSPSNSTSRAGNFPLPKPPVLRKDGSLEEKWRVVTLFFGLIKVLNLRRTPSPTLEDIQAMITGSTFFSTLDLQEGFFELPLPDEAEPFTTFAACSTRLYHYNVLPMGLNVRTDLMQATLTPILCTFYFKNEMTPADDAFFFTKGIRAQHQVVLKDFLQTLEHSKTKLRSPRQNW